MSNITRYDIWHDSWDGLRTDIESDGKWCQYEDHISEVKTLQEEISLLKSKLNFDWDSIK